MANGGLVAGFVLRSIDYDQTFPVRLAYIIDNSAGRDAQLEFGKCDTIAYGSIDDVDETGPPNESGDQ